MNKIEQTTLNMNDINEHHTDMLKLDANCPYAQALFVATGVYDDMLERFIHTFLGDYDYEKSNN